MSICKKPDSGYATLKNILDVYAPFCVSARNIRERIRLLEWDYLVAPYIESGTAPINPPTALQLSFVLG